MLGRKDDAVRRAVHWLQAAALHRVLNVVKMAVIILVIAGACRDRKHILAVMVPVTRCFPQLIIEH
jgi:hypothetical protein